MVTFMLRAELVNDVANRFSYWKECCLHAAVGSTIITIDGERLGRPTVCRLTLCHKQPGLSWKIRGSHDVALGQLSVIGKCRDQATIIGGAASSCRGYSASNTTEPSYSATWPVTSA